MVLKFLPAVRMMDAIEKILCVRASAHLGETLPNNRAVVFGYRSY